MIARFWKRYERVIRFIVVGGGVTLVYSAGTLILLALNIVRDSVAASLIASCFCIPLSFLAHRRLTYKDTARAPDQFGRFVAVGSVNLLVNVGLMRSTQVLGWPVWVALALGWVVVPVANFSVNTLWVFRANGFARLKQP